MQNRGNSRRPSKFSITLFTLWKNNFVIISFGEISDITRENSSFSVGCSIRFQVTAIWYQAWRYGMTIVVLAPNKSKFNSNNFIRNYKQTTKHARNWGLNKPSHLNQPTEKFARARLLILTSWAQAHFKHGTFIRPTTQA